MNTQQILDFINEEIRKGRSRAEIERVLMINQVDKATIDNAFSMLNTPPAQPAPPTPPSSEQTVPTNNREPINLAPMADYQPQPKKSRTGLVISLVIILFLLLAGGAGAYAYFYKPDLLSKIPFVDGFIQTAPAPETAIANMYQALLDITSYSGEVSFGLSAEIPGFTEDSNSQQMAKASGFLRIDNDNNFATKQAKARITVNGNIDAPGMNMGISFEADTIAIDDTLYLKINRLPGAMEIPSFVTNHVGKWIKMDPKALAPELSELEIPAQNPALETELINFAKEMLKSDIIKFGKYNGEEILGGIPTHSYEWMITKEGLKKTLDLLNRFAGKIVTQMGLSEEYDSNISQSDLNEIKQKIDQLTMPTGKIWIGQDDSLPYKISMNRIEIPLPIQEFDPDFDKPIELSVTFDASFRNFNQPTNTQAPTEAKDLEDIIQEVMMEMFGDMMEEIKAPETEN